MSVRILLVCFSLLPSTALAQGRVLVVDASGQSQFLDLPAAIAAANPGDVVRVRPGSYSAFSLTKGISIIGGPSVIIGNTLVPMPSAVRGVPATQTMVLAGLNFTRVSLPVEHCAGPVLIDRVTVPFGLEVLSCAQVQVSASSLHGGPWDEPALGVSRSVVAVSDSTLTGADAWMSHLRLMPGNPGIRASVSSVSLSRCNVTGGAGNNLRWVPSFPAVSSVDSMIWLQGTGAETIRAQGPDRVPGILLVGGSLVMDPLVPVLGFSELPVVSTGTVTQTSLPSLMVTGAPPGGTLVTDVFSPAGDAVLLMASLPAPPLAAATGSCGCTRAASSCSASACKARRDASSRRRGCLTTRASCSARGSSRRSAARRRAGSS